MTDVFIDYLCGVELMIAILVTLSVLLKLVGQAVQLFMCFVVLLIIGSSNIISH